MSAERTAHRPRDEIGIPEIWRALWQGKWIVVAAGMLSGAIAVVYALTATEWYRAEVVLKPAEETDTRGLLGQIGGLASLAGVTLNSNSSNAEALAVLESRDFTRRFLEEEGLLPVLYADLWDEDARRWKSADPDGHPDIRDAVRFFDRSIRTIQENETTGLVTVGIEWTDPDLAAAWANRLVDRVNDHMRSRALLEAEANVDYLRGELERTSVVALQQSIGRLLESELQKVMLARGNEEFAFTVIDRAEPPRFRFRPRRTQLVLLSGIVGGMLASAFVLFRYIRKRGPPA